MHIEVEGTITLEDLRLAFRTALPLAVVRSPKKEPGVSGAKTRQGMFGTRTVWLMFAVLLVTGLVRKTIDDGINFLLPLITDGGAILACILVVFVLIYVLRVFIPRWRFYRFVLPRQHRENQVNYQRSFLLDDVGFVWKNPMEAHAYSWEDIKRWHGDEKQILLFESKSESVDVVIQKRPAKSPSTLFHLLPRHFFTEAQYQELREFLTKRIAAPPPADAPSPPNSKSTPSDGIRLPTDSVKSDISITGPPRDGISDPQ